MAERKEKIKNILKSNLGQPTRQSNVGQQRPDVSSIVSKIKERREKAPKEAPKEEKEKPGFLTSLLKEPVKTLLVKPTTRFGQAIGAAGIYAFGTPEQKKRADVLLRKPTEVDIPILGKYTIEPVKPGFEGVKQAGGEALESAAYLTGTGATKAGISGLRAGLGQAVKAGAKEGALAGGMFGAGEALQEGAGFEEIVGETAKGVAFGGALGGAIPLAGAAIKAPIKAIKPSIEEAIEKGIKPYFSKKATSESRKRYMNKAINAMETINEFKPKLTNAQGITTRRNPRTRAELLEGIGQAKSKIYDLYHKQAVLAGKAGAFFDPKKINKNLNKVSTDLSYSPRIRAYAKKLRDEIKELAGASPATVEARIQDLNSSLGAFLSGRTNKAKARLDASVAKLMREELDTIINQITDKNYQSLKNQYGALKAIEEDVARQVNLELRKNKSSLLDFTDIFTGGDLIGGVTAANPALIARGIFGRGFKEILKYLNDPNRYIRRIFEQLEKAKKPSVFGK